MHRRFCVLLLLACLLLACSTCAFAKETDHISAGDALEGTDKAVYDYLSQQIVLVAAGEVTSTQFAVSAADLGLDQVWTAQDLGMEHIWEDSHISETAHAALEEKMDLDLEHVIDALVFDYPYELYWFNKIIGIHEEYAFSGTVGFPEDTVYFTYFRFSMAVSQDYAVIQDNLVYTYQIDPAKQIKAPAVLAEIQRVVAANAQKSDYEKLVAYKNYICDAVSYNYFAADTPNYPYGDPWQLISVFDGDDSTNVVCEGYAKAFQLLCDLTHFDADIQCILAEGMMHGGPGKGAHMWNIVQIEGRSFLVDVTNCDTGTAGHPDLLFLVGDDKDNASQGFDFCVKVSMTDTITYDYDQITRLLWDEDLLELTKEDFDPTGVIFTWAEDLQSCTALINGESLTCQVETQQEENQLMLTASVVYNGKTYTDEEIIHLEREELVLPKLFTDQQAETVWMLIAGYTEGRLTDLQLVEHAVGGTYDLSTIEGTDIQVFFLNNSNQAPLLPSLNVH